MNPRGALGFTLLEVLVAIFIMSLVISFAFQAYQGIAGAYARVAEISSRDRAARIALDRIERELVGAVLIQREEGADPLLHPYFFYAEPSSSEQPTGSALRFVTQTPWRSPGSPPSALALVTYGLTLSESGQGLVLLRQEEPLPLQLAKQVVWNQPQLVAEDVATFSLSMSGENPEGIAGWDSTTLSQLDLLPTDVSVSLSLWETGPDGEPWPGLEFTRVVHLPVRPFRLSPEDEEGGADENADCGDSMTVTACVEKFSEAIAAASPSLSSEIANSTAQVEDSCWSSQKPSAALQRLKVLMSGLPGFHDGACP